MNKRQKIVQQQFLNNEEEVIERLKDVYTKSLKEIEKKSKALQIKIDNLDDLIDNMADGKEKVRLKSMQQSKIYQKQYQDALKKQIESILDTMHVEEFETISEYLEKCYEEGFLGTMYDLQGQGIPLCFPIDQEAIVRAVQTDSKISQGLYTRLGEDISELKKKITATVSRGISTGMTFQQMAQQLRNETNIGYNNAVRITRTEGHRIQVQSTMDACYKAKDKGANIVKQWDATLDMRTRDSHAQVDGEVRELDEKFSNGLRFPSDPHGVAAEVVNCRCALLQRARWALDDDELETLKERAEFFELDKNDSFEDFKKKYLDAANSHSIGNMTKPKRPRQRDFSNEDDYENAKQRYRQERKIYEEQFDEIIQGALNEKPVFQTKDQVIEWTKKNGIAIDDEVLDVVDLRSFNEVKRTLEEMFEKYPQVKSYQFEDFDGTLHKTVYKIGLTDDGLLSANGGFNFNKRIFADYEQGLREGLEQIAEGWFVRGDGSFSGLVRHEYGHNVQAYIESNIGKKYHHSVDDWRQNFNTFDEWKKAEKAYWEEYNLYEKELVSLAKLKGASEYSQTNTWELFAEGFAEYTSGGKTEFGKAFGEFLERWYK